MSNFQFLEPEKLVYTLEASQLYEPPFNQIHYEGIDGVFADDDADNIFGVVEVFNESAVA